MYTTWRMWYARSVVGLLLNNYFVNPLIEKWYVMEISRKLTLYQSTRQQEQSWVFRAVMVKPSRSDEPISYHRHIVSSNFKLFIFTKVQNLTELTFWVGAYDVGPSRFSALYTNMNK